jgi:hypothetical protein
MPLAVGDVVRLRLVATITAADATTITVTSLGGNPVVFPKAINNDPGFAFETIPTPEPAYVVGELYRDAPGNVYQRVATNQPGDRWRVLVHPQRPPGQYVGEQTPVRPLAHLAPEGSGP